MTMAVAPEKMAAVRASGSTRMARTSDLRALDVPRLDVLLFPVGGALPEPRHLALEPGDPAGDGQRGDAARHIQLLVGVPRQHRQHAVRQRELRRPQPRRALR